MDFLIGAIAGLAVGAWFSEPTKKYLTKAWDWIKGFFTP